MKAAHVWQTNGQVFAAIHKNGRLVAVQSSFASLADAVAWVEINHRDTPIHLDNACI